MPSKEPQRPNGGPLARALRVASKRPRYAVALLAKWATIGGVARLVTEPFGHNAIPRSHCEQALVPQTQAVAGAAHGVDQGRQAREVELGPKVGDVHVDDV